MNQLEELLKKIQLQLSKFFKKPLEQITRKKVSEKKSTSFDKDKFFALIGPDSKTRMIRVIAIGAIVWLALDFFQEEPSQNIEAKPKVKKVTKRKKRRKPRVKIIKEERKQNESKKDTTVTNLPQNKIEDKTKGKTKGKRIEKIQATKTAATERQGIPPETPAKVLEEKKVIEEQSIENADIDDIKLELGESFEVENNTPQVEMEKNDDDEEKSSQLEDLIAVEDKDVKDDRYVKPPNYLRFGRGLVYNCKGKHWACVDQVSFFMCLENEKWNKNKEKPSECVIRNTYATEDDCVKVQSYYTNNSEKTDFCRE